MFDVTPVLTALSLLSLVLLSRLFFSKKHAPLPPGPKRLPLIGNLLDMPSEQEWLTFAQWGEKWGMYPPSLSISPCSSHRTFVTLVVPRRYLFSHRPWPTPRYRQFS